MAQALPSGASLQIGVETARTAAASLYLAESFEALAKANGNPPHARAMVQELYKVAEYRQESRDSSANWLQGSTEVPTNFQIYQSAVVADMAKDLELTKLKIAFAVGPEGQFMRGYSSNGVELEAAVMKKIDQLLYDWLSSKNLVCKDGVIYLADDENQPKLDSKGKPVPVDAKKMQEYIQDKIEGLAAYLQEKNKDMDCSLEENTYPGQEAAKLQG